MDPDLSKLFDRVDHDSLMARLARRVGDRRLLRLDRQIPAKLEFGVGRRNAILNGLTSNGYWVMSK